MTDGLYYFFIILGILLLISGPSLIALIVYKSRQPVVPSNGGIIDKLYEYKITSYVSAAIMIVLGAVCVGYPIYNQPTKISLRG